MKRPLALVGFTYLLAQAVSIFLGAEWALTLGTACLATGFLLLLVHRNGLKSYVLCAAAFTAAAACILFFLSSQQLLQANKYSGRTVRLSGILSEAPDYSNGKAKFILRVETCNNQSNTPLAGKKVQFSSGETFSADQFDRVTGTFHLALPEGNDYFSRKNQLLADGVVLQGYFYDFMPCSIHATEIPLLQRLPYTIRRKLLDSFLEHLPSPEDTLVSGVLVGEKQAVPDTVRDAFRGAGVSHLLCVSGLHMSTVAQMFLLMLGLFPIPKRLRSVLAGIGVVLFMGVTCFSPSVSRSGMMYLLLLSGDCFRRKADSLNSLGLSVLVLCLFNPYAAADISLILSFSATLGIIVCMAPVKPFLFRKKKWMTRKFTELILGTIMMSLSAMLFTLPVSLLAFNEISLVSPFANLLVLTPSSWMIYTGFAAALLSLFPFLTPVASLAWNLTDALARWLILSTQWCSTFPLAKIPTDYCFVPLWLACTLFLLGIACLLCCRHQKLPLQLTAMLSAVLLLLNLFIYQVDAKKLKVTIAASGEGVSAVVSFAGHGAAVGFGAESWKTEHILRRCGVGHLDAAVLLSLSNHECQQAAKIIKDWHPDKVILPAGTVLDGSLEASLPYAGSCISAGMQAQMSLWQRSVLITCENGAANLQMNHLSLLLCGEDADFTQMPVDMQSTQILICGELPKQSAVLQTPMTVLCDYPHSLKQYSVQSRGLPVILGSGKDLVLEPSGSTIRIRRND